jgi:hypothetical protein
MFRNTQMLLIFQRWAAVLIVAILIVYSLTVIAMTSMFMIKQECESVWSQETPAEIRCHLFLILDVYIPSRPDGRNRHDKDENRRDL